MKKILILTIISMSSIASASSFLAGDWCSLTPSQSGHFVRTTDFTTVLQISSNGDFKTVIVGNSSFEFSPSSKQSGFISQGASGAVMQPDLGAGFQEAKKDRKGNLVLEFADGSEQRYARCENLVFAQKLNEIFKN